MEHVPAQSGLAKHTLNLLGAMRRDLPLHIMVTLPDDAVTDRALVRRLLRAGMSGARINCAQHETKWWKKMIGTIRRASREAGVPCKVLMDLSGPKLRTGPMVAGPRVVRIRPRRDALGRNVMPAIVWLGSPSDAPESVACPIVPVSGTWVAHLKRNEKITFIDTRGKKREFVVGRSAYGGRLAELRGTAYVQTGTRLRHKDAHGIKHFTRVGSLPAVELRIALKPGDTLRIHKSPKPGEPAEIDANDRVIRPAHVSCTLPDVFGRVKRGEPVVFDNGIIEGVITATRAAEFTVRVIRTAGRNAALRSDKGINLPRTALGHGGMTAKDRKDLRFAVRHADLVSLSFVRSAGDVLALQREVGRMRGRTPGIVIKIETDQAVRHLPEVLQAARRFPRSGIMMARGDLAIEHGWEQLPGLEALLMERCRAAGLPFLIATQFLETMAKKGIPSRAEIIDVAVASGAQCILLNKGPYLVEAVRMVGKILRAGTRDRNRMSFSAE